MRTSDQKVTEETQTRRRSEKLLNLPPFSVKFGFFLKLFVVPVQRRVSHGGKRRLNQHRFDLIMLAKHRNPTGNQIPAVVAAAAATNVDTLLPASLCCGAFFPYFCSLACPRRVSCLVWCPTTVARLVRNAERMRLLRKNRDIFSPGEKTGGDGFGKITKTRTTRCERPVRTQLGNKCGEGKKGSCVQRRISASFGHQHIKSSNSLAIA